MTKYKIKRYYTKPYTPIADINNKGFVTIWAEIYKYRFGFMVDIINEEIPGDLIPTPLRKNIHRYYHSSQLPKTQSEAEIIIKTLNNSI